MSLPTERQSSANSLKRHRHKIRRLVRRYVPPVAEQANSRQAIFSETVAILHVG
jgi:hypothetical protein